MRTKSVAVAIALVLPIFYVPIAQASQKPVIESFTFTPNDIDVLSANTKVEIELIVSHPSGIENSKTLATLTNSTNDTLSTSLTRIDSPINQTLTKVTYRGSLVVPRDIGAGVYNFTVAPLRNNAIAGYQYTTEALNSKKIRDLVGGEYGLLVRSGESLNLKYDTFVGPTYNSTLGITYNDPITYTVSNSPIWKVGETFNPNKYYELRVPSLSLGITSSTPLVCSSDGKQLKFLKEGSCEFTVSTPKTNDYLSKASNQTVTIAAARIKPELILDKIANQTAKDLPKSVSIFQIYSASEGFVLPQSATPTVCFGNGLFVRIVSGGTCTLTYQTKETATYLASDLYKVSFEVVRDPQTINFTLPAKANISAKNLSLTSTPSGGGAVTYSTSSTGICAISGSTLSLLKNGNCVVVATQVGTASLAPASATSTVVIEGVVPAVKKTITCVKGKTTKKVTGTNPKCPAGYKIKK
jgi:hypothetical protein